MKRIIFVDDEENVLAGLRRMLRPMRKEWDMAFASGGEEALAIMDEGEPFDVVVSDMRMPGMDGVQFLTAVMERHPETVRFALSGHSDSETMLKASNITHRYLNKPCDPELLKSLITQAFALRAHLTNEKLQQMVHKMGTLPSLPSVYQRIMDEIQSEEPSVSKVGEIIEKDVGISVKVLQIVNSALIGLRQRVTVPIQAVGMLGLDNVRSIVLMAGALSPEKDAKLPKRFSLDALWNHSLAVGHFAKKIAALEGQERSLADNAFTAGLLHGVGLLVLATKAAEQYDEILAYFQNHEIPLDNIEQKVFGANHAQIGAYLLELWGLPDSIVEAVAYHLRPSECVSDQFGALTAVHAANCLCNGEKVGKLPHGELDNEYLERIGRQENVEKWRDICQESENES